MFEPKIYLASQSPRRKELLTNAGYRPEIIKSGYEENNNETISPSALVTKHAQGKAKDTADRLKKEGINKGLVIGADTIGVIDNKILGKPKNKENAKKMLRLLSGRKHIVYSGVCIIDLRDMKSKRFVEETEVIFKRLSDKDIEWYIYNDNPLDKAASYSLQERGIRLIRTIHGDYQNIIGLPMINLIKLIESFE